MDKSGVAPAFTANILSGASKSIEQALFDALLDGLEETETIFIVGAPRTGSTLIYQSLCSEFRLPYISNVTNKCYSDTPIIGLALQKAVPINVGFDSSFGKTDGWFQPSEGSAVMSHWFGGGHPSAILSKTILPGAERHFLSTMRAAFSLFGAPLVIKNAWNCFRVEYLAQALPTARFLWIRRDIADAAKSDLEARYRTKGQPNTWNSATPANILELRRLPPTEQVVENQYAFNNSLREGLGKVAADRWTEVWHEDFCERPTAILQQLGSFLLRNVSANSVPIGIKPAGRWELSSHEQHMIDEYLRRHAERLVAERHPSRRKP